MSKVEVDQVDPQSGTTLTLGTSGDTVSIPSGVTLANAGTVTGIPASAISSGTIATARLGSGTASSSTFLRGDQTFAEAGGGKVLQVVQTVKTDIFSTTNTYSSGGFTDITGLSVTITPSATSSKILVLVQIYNSVSANTQFFNLIRGATNLLQPGSGTLKSTIANENNMGNVAITFLDSPSTTSATTYKVATCREAAGTVYINRRSDSANHTGSSTITAIEIGA